MSTRSGKRIHSAIHENMVTTELELPIKSVKKTRSKRLKENDAQLDTTIPKVKKPSNYVAYPAEDEPISEVDASERKNTRRKLRNALKDHNVTVTGNETTDSSEETKKSTRLTRRTKKFAENVEELPESSVVTEVEIANATSGTKGKKSKKKKKSASIEKDLQNGGAPAKKSKKKKKQKRPVNDEANKINDSGMSIDSFHSAAGSPMGEDEEIRNESQDHVAQSPEINVQKLDGTFEKNASVIESVIDKTESKNSSINQNLNGTYDKNTSTISPILNNTFDKEIKNKRKSSIQNATFDKIENLSLSPNLTNGKNSTFDKMEASEKLNSTFEVEPVATRKSLRLNIEKKDSTFEKTPQNGDNGSKPSSLNSTFDKQTRKLDSTFDQTPSQKNSKSSLVSSDDGTINVTFDKSDENIRISITSDESTENIVNTTPVLIESSIDESKISLSPQNPTQTSQEVSEQPPVTPLKREGTFTKDGPDAIIIPTKPKISVDKTPTKRMTLASPGSTPFPTKSTQKSILNVTRSIEKSRRSSLAEPLPRLTRVMFCSPVNNPGLVTLEKKKVIKSSMKGSNKSFLFDDSVSAGSKPAGRKRSFTHNDAEDSRVKRKRLADDMQQSVDRLSRPRTSSATGNSMLLAVPVSAGSKPAGRKRSYTHNDAEDSRVKRKRLADDMQQSVDRLSRPRTSSATGNSMLLAVPVSAGSKPAGRKRSYTHNDAEDSRVKRKRLADDMQQSVDRLSRPRTSSATGNSMLLAVPVSAGSKPAGRKRSYTHNDAEDSRVKRKRLADDMQQSVDRLSRPRTSSATGNSMLLAVPVSAGSKPAGRKRSYTHNDAENSRVKRKRLADDMQQSVDRLSRPRTSSATAKLDTTTPTKKPATPYKKSESKPTRTKLPNFAALHQKEFDKMESLNECQERKAKRAKQLLTPTGAGSPKVATESKLKEHAKKSETPTKSRPETVLKPKLPTLESLRPGYTRFGFKMNCENNPFSIPSKPENKPKEIKPNGIKRNGIKPNGIKPKPLPSLVGATSVRREIAKRTVLREKSLTSLSGKRDEKRKENRTIIKGVRTNRRFELQMRSRNMN